MLKISIMDIRLGYICLKEVVKILVYVGLVGMITSKEHQVVAKVLYMC